MDLRWDNDRSPYYAAIIELVHAGYKVDLNLLVVGSWMIAIGGHLLIAWDLMVT